MALSYWYLSGSDVKLCAERCDQNKLSDTTMIATSMIYTFTNEFAYHPSKHLNYHKELTANFKKQKYLGHWVMAWKKQIKRFC